MRKRFKHRFLGLALEAFRRDEVSDGKLRELVAMVGLTDEDLRQLLEDANMSTDVTRSLWGESLGLTGET